MSALADKLWFGPGQSRAAVEESNERSPEVQTPQEIPSPRKNQVKNEFRVSGGSESLSKRLGETQIAGSPYQPTMTFTYAPGSRPFSPYTIRRGVGVGGFGEVYFALSDAGKEVALKRIQRNLEVELRGVVAVFESQTSQPRRLYDIARDETEQSWVVMEYVAGPNLREVLDSVTNGAFAR